MQISSRPRRVLSIFVLAMLNVSIMASLRNLFTLVAEFGLSAIFFFVLVAIFFLIPCALSSPLRLATGWPKSGGIYIWVREGLGDRWGFMAIWMQWVHNVAWYPVIMSFIAVTLAFLISPTLTENKFYVLGVILVGFWGMTLLNYLGIKTSGWFSTIGVILGTIVPGLFVIFLGVYWGVSGNPIQTQISWGAVLPSMGDLGNLVFLAGLFLAFAGLEVSASYASDVQNPQRNFPRAIVLGSVITFGLFMLGSLSIAFVIPKTEMSLVAGLMEAFRAFFQYYHMEWILPIIAFLLIVGAIAEVNSWIIGPVRGLHATSIHGNLPHFSKNSINMKCRLAFCFSRRSSWSITSLVFLYMPQISSGFWTLTALSAQSYLIMYILMFIAALKLRYTKPHVPRAYKVPFQKKGIWLFASLGIISSCFAILLCFVPPANLKIGSPLAYFFLLFIGLFVMVSIPLVIYKFKKPHWTLKPK